ncbi:MAG: TPM domain-containing protein [Candidatus Omnitrophota bacterium]
MKRTALIFSICGLLASVPLYGREIPAPRGWVNDFANVIPDEYRLKLEAVITELETKSSAEVAVVTIGSIAPYDEKAYARMLFDEWKPGKKGKDNGVLVLVAVKERRWRIEVGYGLEGALPDSLCGEIGRTRMVPYFGRGEYGKGLYYGVSAIAEAVAKEYNVPLDGVGGDIIPAGDGLPPFLYIFVPIFFFIWNLPWPVPIGLTFTLFFAAVFFGMSRILGVLVIAAYLSSMLFRYRYWKRLPPDERKGFFGPQTYGGTFSGTGGGFGGGGFGGGGGGFGGGGGGGGGAGGGF